MSDNQTSLQLPHDLLSDDGQNITFRLSTAADWCIVVNYPLSSVIKLSELGKIRMIAPNQVNTAYTRCHMECNINNFLYLAHKEPKFKEILRCVPVLPKYLWNANTVGIYLQMTLSQYI